MTRTTHRAIAAAAILATAMASACDSDRQPNRTAPTTAVTTSASPASGSSSAAPQTRDEATRAAVDAYVGMQNAFLHAGQLGDPDHPDLRKYATGSALTQLTNGLESYKSKGLLIRGQARYHPQIVSLA